MNIWAHRGCSYRYPENTLSAFQEAVKYDITGVELDIQLTRDKKMVVIHDEKVDRTTNGRGNVADMTLAQIKQLRIIPKEESKLAYETIPTIHEVFELLAPECFLRGLLINIELKNSVVRYEGMEQQILRLVKEYGIEDYIIYSSFNPESVKLIKELNPRVKTGILCSSLQDCLDIAEETKADALHPYIHKMDVPDIRKYTDLPIRVWNVGPDEILHPQEGECVIYNLKELEKEGVTDIFTNAPENYVDIFLENRSEEIYLDAAKAVNRETGYLVPSDEYYCATAHLYRAQAGSLIKWINKEYSYMIYLYSMDTAHDLIYTYCYQKEENWATYEESWSDGDWLQENYRFDRECYFRICVRHADGSAMEQVPVARELLEFWKGKESAYHWPSYFQAEAMLTVKSVSELRKRGDLVLFLLTDSHYVINGTWEDTAYNMAQVAKEVNPDAVIHLGDVTDGMLPLAGTKEYADRVISDLKRMGRPVYLCIGNHDSNYFGNNPEKMTEEEMSHFYLNKEKPYYYVDNPKQKLRMLFLYSFDYQEKVRYGYPAEELEWVKQTLEETRSGWSVLVFSHVPPLPEIHFWSNEIRNGEELVKILEAYHTERGHKVLGLIHGHNHAEQIYRERSFPIISIGCNKLEDFKDRKPTGAYTCDRKRNTVTQDLWDVLIIPKSKKRLELIRFGAGEDRTIVY